MREKMLEEIKKTVEERIGFKCKVSIKEIRKNNGVSKTAVVIDEPENNLCPAIYIDDMIKDEDVTVEEIADYVIGVFLRKVGIEDKAKYIISGMNKEAALRNVTYHLVNKDKNEDILKNVPHKEFLDLAVLYRFVVDNDKNHYASFVVSNAFCDKFTISFEELDKAAMNNTKEKSDFNVRPMSDFLAEISGMPEEGFELSPMYVLTNRNGINGATIMIYEEYFKELADKVGCDLYILPSSIHECLAVPAYGFESYELMNMVNEVNTNEVSEEEILSYNVYRYSRKEGRITIADVA